MDSLAGIYSAALTKLNEAETRVGAEDEAEALLSRAISLLPQGKRNTEQNQMMYVLQELLGRVVESKDQSRALECYRRAIEAVPDQASANLHLARLQWKCASEAEHMVNAEMKLRQAIVFSARDGDDEMTRDAQELLARLLLQAGKQAECADILKSLGYTHTFAAALANGTSTSNAVLTAAAAAAAAATTAAASGSLPLAVIDCALGPAMLNLMRKALAHDSIFWRENNYQSPRTGYFSFQHKLPPFSAVSNSGVSSSSGNGLELMLHHVWRCAASAIPKVKKARYVEWWAHSRQHCYGHQLHFDSVPGARAGVPRHPIISTVTFLTAECGGPTLITDQTISNKVSSTGWLVAPCTNRIVCFDGSLLHCVLPGAGAAPSADARRTTFMAAFWEEDPRAPPLPPVAKDKAATEGKERGVLKIDRGGSSAKGAKRFKYVSSSALEKKWPASFSGPDLQEGVLERVLRSGASPKVNAQAIVHLTAGDIWEVVDAGSKQPKKQPSKKRKVSDATGLDLMGQGVFTLSEGLLGLGMRSDPSAHSY
jgi:hypothetical protein